MSTSNVALKWGKMLLEVPESLPLLKGGSTSVEYATCLAFLTNKTEKCET